MISFFRHAKIQVPLAQIRNATSSIWRSIWAMAGRYQPLSADERALVAGAPVPFKGDIPVGAGSENNQRRADFAQPRALVEKVEDLVVTPLGAGWKDGCLFEKYSVGKPGLRMLMGDHRPAREVEEGYFIQSEHTDTFGDWISEYLSPLSHLPTLSAPVFLPRALAQKSFVQRDAERTGGTFVEINEPILIRKAQIVRQRRCIRYWRPDDIVALRKFLNVTPSQPIAGSLLYLSRHGEVSEVADRSHPNLLVEEVVKARGGKVLRTGETSLEDYLAAAQHAETILYDHGSAAYNMVYWRPRRAVEFVSDAWWMNSFLFFADSVGVCDYTVVCTDRGSLDEVRARLTQALDRPLDQ